MTSHERRRERRRRAHARAGGRCYWCGKRVYLPEQILLASFGEIIEGEFVLQRVQRHPRAWQRWKDELATLEHIRRVADGGTNDDGNLTVACPPCNNQRHPKSDFNVWARNT